MGGRQDDPVADCLFAYLVEVQHLVQLLPVSMQSAREVVRLTAPGGRAHSWWGIASRKAPKRRRSPIWRSTCQSLLALIPILCARDSRDFRAVLMGLYLGSYTSKYCSSRIRVTSSI